MPKEIYLTNGTSVLVDEDDYNKIKKWKWYLSGGYASRSSFKNGVSKIILMHRFINKTPKGKDTDHVNGNRFDNRKENLRSCTTAENTQNRHGLNKTNTTGFRGVYLHKGKYRRKKYDCILTKDKKRYFLGLYFTPQEASIVYELKRRELFA